MNEDPLSNKEFIFNDYYLFPNWKEFRVAVTMETARSKPLKRCYITECSRFNIASPNLVRKVWPELKWKWQHRNEGYLLTNNIYWKTGLSFKFNTSNFYFILVMCIKYKPCIQYLNTCKQILEYKCIQYLTKEMQKH